MAISLKTAGTWARVVADPSSVTIPGTPAAGDRMFLFVTWKTYTITLTTPSGWTPIGTVFADGTVASGNGTGSVRVMAYYRDWVSGDGNPSLDWSASPTEAHAVVMLWQKASVDVWSEPQTVTAAMTNWTTSSQTFSASSTLTIRDSSVVMGLVGIRDDSATMTRPTTGIANSAGFVVWNGNYVESPATHFTSTTGEDMSGDLGHRFVTTSGANITLSMTGTISAAETGAGKWVVQELEPLITQAAYRFYEDGSETTSVAIDSQNTNISRDVTSNSNVLLRVRLQETGGVTYGAGTDDYQLQYSLNSGSYTDVGSGSVVGFSSASLTDGASTTERLTGGSGSFSSGKVSEDGLVDNINITASNFTEHLYSITLVSSALSNNDTLDFRLLRNGLTTGLTYTATPRITATKAVNYTGTPTAASLTLSTFTPSVIINNLLVPNTQSLSLTTFTPVVLVNTRLTPANTSLSLTTFAPTVTFSDNQSFAPATASLTLSTHTPTVLVSDNTVVTPATASLSLATFTISVFIGTNITPATSILTLTTFDPTVVASDNKSATPSTATLALTQQTPTLVVSDNTAVSPSIATLTLTTFAPTIVLNLNVVAATGNLGLTNFAPTVAASDNKSVTPSVATLTLTPQTPTVNATDNKTATPDTATLTLAAFAPTVSGSGNQSPTPDTASLTLTTFAPMVSASNSSAVTPETAALTLTTFAPSATLSDNVSITLNSQALSLTTFEPTATVSSATAITPSSATLTLTQFAPTSLLTTNYSGTPATASLTLTVFAPSIAAADNKSATPATGSLALTGFAPEIVVSDNTQVTAAATTLSIATQTPVVIVTQGVSLTPGVSNISITTFIPSLVIANSVVVTPITIVSRPRPTPNLTGNKKEKTVNGDTDSITLTGNSRNSITLTGNKND